MISFHFSLEVCLSVIELRLGISESKALLVRIVQGCLSKKFFRVGFSVFLVRQCYIILIEIRCLIGTACGSRVGVWSV